MTSQSNLSKLILLLHDEAARLGRVTEDSFAAEHILRVLRARQFHVKRPWRSLPSHVRIGIELRQGRVADEDAKKIQRAATQRLQRYDSFLLAADRLGYTPHVVKAALLYHWDHLENEPLGSDGYCVRVDLLSAMSRVSSGSREVAQQMILSSGAAQFSRTNGGHSMGAALYEISQLLEGGQRAGDTVS